MKKTKFGIIDQHTNATYQKFPHLKCLYSYDLIFHCIKPFKIIVIIAKKNYLITRFYGHCILFEDELTRKNILLFRSKIVLALSFNNDYHHQFEIIFFCNN